MKSLALAAGAVALGCVSPALADILPSYGESTNTLNTPYLNGTAAGNPATDAADGNSSSYNSWVAGSSDGTGTETTNASSGSYYWYADAGSGNYTASSTLWYILDLDQVYNVSELAVWNANQSGLVSRGVQTANVYTGNSLYNLTEAIAGQTFTEGPGSTSYNTPQIINLSGVQTRYVALQITSNYGDSTYTVLSHVQAYGNSTPVGYSFPSSSLRIPIVSATATSTAAGSATNIANNTDLTAEPSVAYNAGYVAGANQNNEWVATGTSGQSITMNLGSSHALGQMEVWNYLYNTTAGGNNLRAADGITVTILNSAEQSVGSFTTSLIEGVDQDDGTGDFDRPNQINLTGYTGQYVEITINSNYGDGSYSGLAGVQIFAAPEPGTLGLIAVGSLAVLRRRRRNPAGSN